MILQLEELVTSGKLVFPLLFSTVNPLYIRITLACHATYLELTGQFCGVDALLLPLCRY